MAESSKREEKQCTKPVCIITLGMAGSGKTTFVQVKNYNDTYEMEPRCV